MSIPDGQFVCANCDGLIGRLEAPRLHQGHMICPACYVRLNPPAPPAPPSPPLSMAGPTLLTLGGFAACIGSYYLAAQAFSQGGDASPAVKLALAASGLVFLAGLAWFIVNRIRKD